MRKKIRFRLRFCRILSWMFPDAILYWIFLRGNHISFILSTHISSNINNVAKAFADDVTKKKQRLERDGMLRMWTARVKWRAIKNVWRRKRKIKGGKMKSFSVNILKSWIRERCTINHLNHKNLLNLPFCFLLAFFETFRTIWSRHHSKIKVEQARKLNNKLKLIKKETEEENEENNKLWTRKSYPKDEWKWIVLSQIEIIYLSVR